MKRHISIFAFLLGAFAAAAFMPSADAATREIYVGSQGYWKPGDTQNNSNLVRESKVISPDEVYDFISTDETIRFTAVPPEKGYAVAGWYQSPDQQMESPSLIDDLKDDEIKVKYVTEGKLAIDLTYIGTEPTMSEIYLCLGISFCYLEYNVKYDRKGGTGDSPEKNDVPYTNRFNLAAAPLLTGYTFGGWLATPIGKTFGAGVEVGGAELCPATWHEDNSNVTMVAQWTTNRYAIACDLYDGTWPTGYQPPAEVPYDTVFSLSAPHRTGYDFIGWKVTGLDAKTARWGTTKSPSSVFEENTLCFNGEKDVYFKNLNPTDGETVTLSAQWRAKTIRVTFNNAGGSSGGGVLSFLDVTYAAVYPAVDVPSRGGYLFRGYEINGSLYWDREGQVQKQEWDIPTNCTAVAQWEAGDYELIYDENKGVDSKQVRRKFEYDTPTKLYDGADFSNLGCTLLGWSTNKQAEKPDDGCEIGGVKSFTGSKTLYAVWEKNYFIAYDGNGATNETPMAVQKLVFGKLGQSLNPNTYGKVGYTFDGWATNRAAALLLDRAYKDREIITKDLATTVGETNTLYAIWKTNTYYVAFDPNGGTGAPMSVRSCKYDQPVTLPEATYDHGAYDFVGWSNDVEKVIYTNLSEPVSNLCATAKGTNTLFAVWKLSELSAAIDCTNLRWDNVPFGKVGKNTDEKWQVSRGGSNTWSCALQEPEKTSYPQTMTSSAITNSGTLTFFWRPEGNDGSFLFWIDELSQPNYPSRQAVPRRAGTDGVWEMVTTSIVVLPGETRYIHLANDDFTSSISVDLMTWTPDRSEPVDGKDNVTISSAAVSDGKFILSFASDAQFDYNLLTNANLLINSWGVMTNEVGTGETITFKPQIIEGQPQLFYKVETIQKK